MSDLLLREFNLPDELSFREEGARLYVRGLVVPYMIPTPIVEMRPDGPVSYREQFAPEAFRGAVKVPHRVTFTYGHDEGLSERLGSGFAFDEDPSGLFGEFLIDRRTTDITRDVVETSHGSLSVGFIPQRPAPFTEREGQLVTRTSAVLRHVAAVPVGAYPDARILAVAARDGDDPNDEPSPAEIEIAERERRTAELFAWVDTLSR
jgi:HK97 family phage prohead protease